MDFGDISDGYHTFNELYEHRNLQFIMICLAMRDECRWKKDMPGWFILYLNSDMGQISYHIPEKYLYMVERFITKLDDENTHYWDGHNSQDVIKRFKGLINAHLADLDESEPVLGNPHPARETGYTEH